MLTFAAVLADRLRREPGRPLVTFYDDETGERVELSVTTYANWVAKAGSLLVDELGLERGDTLRVDLPPHWLTPVFLGAAWSAGLVVTDADDPAAVVCGPDRLDRWAREAAERVVLACSLLPLGVRFAAPVPTGVHDVGIDIWSQPDAFVPWDPPGDDDGAVDLAGVRLTQQQMWEAGAPGARGAPGGPPPGGPRAGSPPDLATFTEPLAKGGSVVLVTRAGAERLEAIDVAEHATARFPA
ncbi:TIGR03089 family protein [Nocardioides sp. HM23]|uniref:TIGR03089 family protein n=1 Tax=Nocardioides bizhenqiangii TaxID=3095076 RepID=UPI002ACA7303|nr:TIGR03089 family protein [Nocardioides sp. HM23]MDZ5621214.1 TIGR03089 family protein [Nocardioides sp. HM23]